MRFLAEYRQTCCYCTSKMNIKNAIIALSSIIVAMLGFTLKSLINNSMTGKVDIHENKNGIEINKLNIDNLKGRVDRRCK